MKWIKKFIGSLKKKDRSQYLFRSGWDLNGGLAMQSESLVAYSDPQGSIIGIGPDSVKGGTKIDERIEKKPVEVYKEIMTETPKMDISNIDAQIKLVERRLKMFKELDVNNVNTSDEYEALEFLKARKKGLKVKVNFGWAPTTLPMIEALVKKYKLALVTFEGYAKNIPMDAIDELEKFLHEYAKVRDDRPVLRLVIDDTPQSKEKKKDPILLALSPFGKFFYILGAWDKEVEVVDDLVYHGK